LVTSADVPKLDCAYKLMEYAGRPRWKRSEGKRTVPWAKQVWRVAGRSGRLRHDVVTRADVEAPPVEGAAPLLECVMREGRRVAPSPSLEEIRARVARELAALPPAVRRLQRAAKYQVRIAIETP
jgi:nicotinate phosphoribosyltransferase